MTAKQAATVVIAECKKKEPNKDKIIRLIEIYGNMQVAKWRRDKEQLTKYQLIAEKEDE